MYYIPTQEMCLQDRPPAVTANIGGSVNVKHVKHLQLR